MDDGELVRRVLAGQTADFRLLVERHQASVLRFAVGLLGSREEAEDIVQEVFLAAYSHLASYEFSRGALSTWLFTIARNRCLNLLKRSRPVVLREPQHVQAAIVPDALVDQDILQYLDRALAALPVEQRSAFVLAEIEELPYAEIARVEGISLGTVKSRIHRAKQQLRTMLEPFMRELT